MTRLPATPFHDNPKVAHGRRRVTKGVVVHTVEGTDEGAEAWFKDRRAKGLGAHVIIGQESSRTIQVTDLNNICYHASGANEGYIGIEHEGFARYSKAQWLKKVNRHMLRASANRVGWICWHYRLGIPTRKNNVFGHADFPQGGHEDPGKGWPWLLYIFLARRAYSNLTRTGKW